LRLLSMWSHTINDSRVHRMAELGLESGRVRVVPYSEAWPALYAAEVARLGPLVSAAGVSILFEHTGSTAVPDLGAKPIIDILAGVGSESERAAAIAALQGAGYVHRGEQDIPGRDFFRRGDPRQYHLHLTRVGSSFWHDQRTFRDWLRTHPDAARGYMILKQRLAVEFPSDREAYIRGKTAFVEEILLAARPEHSRHGQ
jgi:GrpB-like predicted nucleotidyltransferase (UPF0157 family)